MEKCKKCQKEITDKNRVEFKQEKKSMGLANVCFNCFRKQTQIFQEVCLDALNWEWFFKGEIV